MVRAAPAAPVLGIAPSSKELRARLADLTQAANKPSPSVLDSLAFQLDVADRIAKDFAPQSELWRARAARMIEAAKAGRDPFVEGARGKIVMRGYTSPISRVRQGYAISLPKDYDPARAYPLMVVLHGGSANGNLFLGVVLGNNMNWKEYEFHLWDEFEPRWASNFIMVAPDGFGQVMWRFMGEQDVLDVIADVERNYKVDDDRVVLLGLSNGGVGAYNMGLRHASRFAAVLAIAGCPSWTQYAGRVDAFQTEALKPQSGMWIAENMIDTDFRFFHGHEDPGPMRPAFVEEFSKHIATLGVPYKEKWYDAGHDLLYLVLQYGGLFKKLENVTRNRHPKEVRVVTGDYRAAQQHWVTVTGIERFPSLARVKAVADGTRLRVETSNTRSLTIALSDVPLTAADGVSLEVDGQVVYDGARAKLGTSVVLSRGQDGRWQVGSAAQSASSGSNSSLAKKPGVSGPITDAYFGSMLHVYGTSVPAQTEALKKAAQRGARGWPVWLWRVEQPVVADSEVTEAMMREHHLVLYGTPGSNSILSRIEAKLPIHVDADGVVVGDRRFSSKGVGTRFIYPNPLAPDHYVIVQAAPTPEGVMNGHNLPDFLPDYVVYDQRTTRERPRLVFDLGHTPLLLGSFDEAWRLDPSRARSASPQQAPRKPAAIPEGNDPESAAHDRSHSHLPVSPAPPVPPAPTTFATNAASPTGKTAREIARRVQTFTNYRSKIPGATWTLDDTSRWSIREPEACLKQLEELGVHAKAWTRPLSTPVAVPVRIEGKVDDVEFRMMHAAAGGVVSCELAAHLPEIARIVKAHGVHTVHVLSAYRDHPYTSFHTLGLALDLAEFDTDRGPLIVKTDFIIDHEHETCDGPEPANDKARTLRAIACDLAATHHFSSVLTPNYNVGHRDHFHLDVRPDDPRLFLR